MIEIPLTNGRGVALVDDEDAWAARYEWRLHNEGYATRKRSILLHREIMERRGVPIPSTVDHRNLNKLDNRFENLRPATQSQNNANSVPRSSSGFKGVVRDKTSWRAEIKNGGATVTLGVFDSSEDAARAYDVAARRAFGEFARLNFPGEFHAPKRRAKRSDSLQPYRGVQFHGQVWRAVFFKKIVGTFAIPEDAALAYDAVARERLGAKAILNFPDEGG